MGCDRYRVNFLLLRVSVSFNMLHQRAPQNGVQQLQPATNRQYRQVALQRLAQEDGLKAVSIMVQFARLGVAWGAVYGRIDIASSGEQQAIETGNRSDILDWLNTCATQRVAVWTALACRRAASKWQCDSDHVCNKTLVPSMPCARMTGKGSTGFPSVKRRQHDLVELSSSPVSSVAVIAT